MSIKDKLNSEFEEGKQSESCFSFRALSQNCYEVIKETIDRLEEIKNNKRFDKIDVEIKQEAQAVLNIFKQTLTALDPHKELLNWTQPETE